MGIRLKRTGITSSHNNLMTSSSSSIKGRRFEASLVTHVLIRLPHLYVYHMCTRALHMSSPLAKAILVMHALSWPNTVTAIYNVGKQLARNALETTNPEKLSIAGDLQADLD